MRTPALASLALVLGLVGCHAKSAGDDAPPNGVDLTSAPAPADGTSSSTSAPGAPGSPGGSGSTGTKADGAACGGASECASGVCAGTCQAPSPTDGVKNGDETDVDCGGASAPKCVAGLACKAASDCAANACSAAGKCQIAPSCTGKLGADEHCGPGQNESCCASARVPDVGDGVDYSVAAWSLDAHVSAYKLDKYEVTVGRLRAFFDAMNGNVQANFEPTVGANAGANPHVPGSGWHSSWNKRLPASWADISSRYGDPAEAEGSQFCMRGAGGEYGTTTYKKNADANESLIDNFELKPVVCLDWYTLFAFCAWDGGRLPTSTEWGVAAGDDVGYKYSWGNDAPANDNVVTALNGFVPYPDFTWGIPYRWSGDRGTHVAPVGQKRVARYGQYDLSGNAGEWLLDSHVPTGSCVDCADISTWSDPTLAWPNYEATLGAGDPTWQDGGVRVVRGGTWEGHDIRNVEGVWNGMGVGFTYHALGGRCARDL